MRKSKKFPGVYVHDMQDDESFYIMYRAGGRQIKEKVGRKSEGYTQKMAADIRGSRIVDARHGKIIPKKKRVPTFYEAYTQMMDSKISVSEDRMKQIQGRYSKYLHGIFGCRRITEITPASIRSLIKMLEKAGYRSSTIKHYLSIVSMVFDHMEMKNPVKYVKYHAEDRVRQRFLTKDEARRLIDAIPKNLLELKMQVQIMLLTGMRLSECMNITGMDVCFSSKRIHVTGKGRNGVKKERFVEMNESLERLLRQFGVTWSGLMWIFPFDRAAFDRAVVRAGLGTSKDRIWKVTPHTLRHTFGSWLGQQGTSPLVIQEAMGHSKIQTSMRYAKLGDRATASAVGTLEL